MSETAKLALQLTLAGAQQARSGLNGVATGVRGVGDSLSKTNEQLFYFLNNARSIGGVAADIGKAVIDPNIQWDEYRKNLTYLLKDADLAEQKLDELFNLANAKEFKVDEVVQFYLNLHRVSDGALAGKEKLELFLDAAERSGQGAAAVGQLLAEAWFALERGAGIDTVAATMKRLGLITPTTVNEIRKLQEAGGDTAAMWRLVESAIKETTSAVAGTDSTWTHITNKLENYQLMAKKLVGEKLFEAMKGDLDTLGSTLDEVFDSGRMEQWAAGIAGELASVYEKIKDMSLGGLNMDDIFASLDTGNFLGLMAEIGKTAALNFWDVMTWGAQQYGPDIQRAMIPDRLHGMLGLNEDSQPLLLSLAQMVPGVGGLLPNAPRGDGNIPFPTMRGIDEQLISKIRFGDFGGMLNSITPYIKQLNQAGLSISGVSIVDPSGNRTAYFSKEEAMRGIEQELKEGAADNRESSAALKEAAMLIRNAFGKF